MPIQGTNHKRGSGVRAALVSFAAAMAWLAMLPGCIGAGDDGSVASVSSDGGDAGDAKNAGDARDAGDAGSAGDAANAGDTKASEAQAPDATLSGDGAVKDGAPAADATLADGPATQSGAAVAQFNSAPIDWGMVGCLSTVAQTFTIKNLGTATLIVAANATTVNTTTGTFTLDRTNLSIDPGASQSLSIAAAILGSAAAGSVLEGSLALITTDRSNPRISIPLSATAMGATIVLAGGATVAFPATKVGTAAAAVPFTLQNIGNGPATITFGRPSIAEFSVVGVSGAGRTVDIAASGELPLTANFTPSQDAQQSAASTIGVTAVAMCGTSVGSVSFQGTGTAGYIVNGPQTLPFQANCGGQAPAPIPFTLKNVGTVPVQVNPWIDPADAGFFVTPSTASIPSISALSPEGGTSTFLVYAPPFPAQTGDGGTEAGNMPGPIQATLKLPSDANKPQSDAGDAGNAIPDIALTEDPQGASLTWGSSASQSIVLNAAVGTSSAQSVGVVNKGKGPTTAVTLTLVPTAAPDAGAEAGLSTDGSVVAGAGPFTFDQGTITSQPQVSPGAQGASAKITFAPAAAVDSFANVVMSVDPTVVLCAQLPQPLPVQGHGSGLGVDPTDLTFYATCDGKPVPTAQFTIGNTLKDPLTWAIGAIVGPGAANYAVTAISVMDTTTMTTTNLAPPLMNTPRSLASTEVATVTVAVPQALPSAATMDGGAPWTAPLPSALAASLNVDSPAGGALVLLNEIPVGDRLSVSLGSQKSVPITNMSFGPVPVNSPSPAQPFVITNDANPVPSGTYAGAKVSITASGDAAFALSPPSPTAPLPPEGSLPESVVFTPTSGGPSSGATIAIAQADPTAPLCAPLPVAIALSGTGMQAVAVVSPMSHDFGPVNCGAAAGVPAQFTVSNPTATSNLPFKIVSLVFTKLGSSPYDLQPDPDLSAPIAPGGSLKFSVVTKPLPTTGVDPSNTSAFNDTLTVTTDIPSTFAITLTLQPQGAVIVDTVPALRTTWNFGAVAFGSTGTIFSQIENTGNAAAMVTLAASMDGGSPQLLPAVFDLAPNPTNAPAGITQIEGRFVPSVAGGSWVGLATLTVSGPLCQPLPAQWVSPTLQLSGNSP